MGHKHEYLTTAGHLLTPTRNQWLRHQIDMVTDMDMNIRIGMDVCIDIFERKIFEYRIVPILC
jgi:hypothetical protein